MAKMQNLPSKFHYFSFQSSKFAFDHFSSLSFKTSQFSPSVKQSYIFASTPPKRHCFGLILNFIYLFLNFKKTLINKKPKIKNKTKPQSFSIEQGREGDGNQEVIGR